MRKSITNKIDEQQRNIDWEEVKKKISILCRKFDNIDARYRDDLAQELLIHAYYVSDDYYDLQRRAIDFWREMTRKVYPEIPFIDMEIIGGTRESEELDNLAYKETLAKIRRELQRGPWENVYAKELDEIASRILDIILEDIEGVPPEEDEEEITITRYRAGRINCTYIDTRMPDVHYKRIRKGVKRLEEVLEGLMDMDKI